MASHTLPPRLPWPVGPVAWPVAPSRQWASRGDKERSEPVGPVGFHNACRCPLPASLGERDKVNRGEIGEREPWQVDEALFRSSLPVSLTANVCRSSLTATALLQGKPAVACSTSATSAVRVAPRPLRLRCLLLPSTSAVCPPRRSSAARFHFCHVWLVSLPATASALACSAAFPIKRHEAREKRTVALPTSSKALASANANPQSGRCATSVRVTACRSPFTSTAHTTSGESHCHRVA